MNNLIERLVKDAEAWEMTNSFVTAQTTARLEREAAAELSAIRARLQERQTAIDALAAATETRIKRGQAGCGFSFMEVDYGAAVRVEASAIAALCALATKV